MAEAREGGMHDDDFGRNSGGRFKATINKQRVFAVPRWRSKASLEISPELRKDAEAGDKEAVSEAVRISKEKIAFENRLNEARPRVLEFTLGEEPGYLYIPTWSNFVHFLEDKQGVYTCKLHEFRAEGKIGPDELAPCCVKAGKEAARNTSVLLGVYQADVKGEVVEIEKMLQEPLDGDTRRINFSFEYQTWGLHDKKASEWVDAQLSFPAISSDFVIWRKTADQFAPTVFNASGHSFYRTLSNRPTDLVCEAMIRKILKESPAHYERAARDASGQDLTYDQQIAKWVTNPQAVGSVNRPQVSSSQFLSPGR